MRKKIDTESFLSSELVAKQKEKGTFDSPCLSICNYKEDLCPTCGLKKAEKGLWKMSGESAKKKILEKVLARSVSEDSPYYLSQSE